MTKEESDKFDQDIKNYLDACYESALKILNARIYEAMEFEPMVVHLDTQSPWPWEKKD